MVVIGIAGTRGKTILTHLLYQIFQGAGVSSAYISSNGHGFNNEDFEGSNIHTINRKTLRTLVEKLSRSNVNFLFVEVSSKNLRKRLYDDLSFDLGVITNMKLDDPVAYKNLKDYADTKMDFIDLIKDHGSLILNSDDQNTIDWIKSISPLIKKDIFCEWFGQKDIYNTKYYLDGMAFYVQGFGDVTVPVIGRFNQSYIVKAAQIASKFLNKDVVARSLNGVRLPAGKLDFFVKGPGFVVIDHAQTLDAMEESLFYLSKTKPKTARLITVFGVNSRKSNLIQRGRISAMHSDLVILTSEDPNSEDVFDINSSIHQQAENHNGVLLERLGSSEEYSMIDKKNLKTRIEMIWSNGDVPFIAFDMNNYAGRLDAINLAVALANEGDIVYIAGKGNDSSTLYNNIEYEWSDYEAVRMALEEETIEVEDSE